MARLLNGRSYMELNSNSTSKKGVGCLETDSGEPAIGSKLALLQLDFPTIMVVMKDTWFIVPALNIALLVIPFLVTAYLPQTGLTTFISALLQIGNLFLFVSVCLYLLGNHRQKWALSKILQFNADPSQTNQVFLLVHEVCQAISKKGSYEVNHNRSKPERYLLEMIMKLFDSIGFLEDC